MPYITRDQKNKIISLYKEAQIDGQEFLESADPEVEDFLKVEICDHENHVILSQSDFGLIRVIEDLIDLLIEKHIIIFTELPVAAQNKLLDRKSVREHLDNSIIDTEENNIF